MYGDEPTTISYEVSAGPQIPDFDIEVSGSIDIDVNGSHIGYYEIETADVEIAIESISCEIDLARFLAVVVEQGKGSDAIEILAGHGIKATSEDEQALVESLKRTNALLAGIVASNSALLTRLGKE